MNKKVKFLVYSALIAAIYATLTIAFKPISYGEVQIRISEMLTVLPFFTPAAVPGLFIGCLVSNILSPNGLPDIVFGSIATLLAAWLSSKMKKKYLVPLPPVIVNAFIIGIMLSVLYNLPMIAIIGWVGLGELIACYGLGYPFMLIIEKYNIFRKDK